MPWWKNRWEGNRLIGDFNDGLYDEQYLKVRISLPREGFKTSGPGLTAWLSRHWYFNRWIFIGVVAAILASFVLSLAALGAWLWVHPLVLDGHSAEAASQVADLPEEFWPLFGPLFQQPCLFGNAVPVRPAPLRPILSQCEGCRKKKHRNDSQALATVDCAHIKSPSRSTK